MEDIELVDAVTDDAAVDDEEGVPGPSRRRRWWLIPAAAAVVVLALVAYQGITDARERSLLAGLADVPGVLAPIDPDLPIRWDIAGPTTQAAAYGIVADGAAMNIVVDPDGSQRVVAVDLATGAERWSTVVYGPNAGLAKALQGRGGTASGYCLPVGPEAVEPTSLACMVSDGFQTSDGENAMVPATETLVRVLDTHDGHEIAQRPTGEAGITVSGGRVVLARLTYDGVDVAGYEPTSGGTVWSRHLVVPHTAIRPDYAPSVQSVGGLIEVTSGSWAMWLDEDGVPLAVQPERDGSTAGSRIVEAPTADRFLAVTSTSSGTTSTELLGADGTVEHTLSGDPAYLAVDDGSVPNLILTLPSPSAATDDGEEAVRVGSLRGSDATTGRTLWTADVSKSGYGTLVLLGRVYVLGGQGVVVLDGRSGKLLWTIEPPDNVTYGAIMTDGRSLLAVRNPGQAGGDRIDAYSLTGPDQVWSAPIPAGLDEVHAVGTMLVGVAYAGPQYLRDVVRVARLG